MTGALVERWFEGSTITPAWGILMRLNFIVLRDVQLVKRMYAVFAEGQDFLPGIETEMEMGKATPPIALRPARIRAAT